MMTAGDILVKLEPLALAIGRRYPRKDGIERDDLVGEAWLALHGLASKYLDREAAVDEPPMEKWFAKRIREHLRTYTRKTLWGFLEGVPPRLRRKAITVYMAAARLKARGILRPSYEQVAGEARLSIEVVLLVAACPKVIRRQSLAEWCEDKGAVSGPGLVPMFGPQPGWTRETTCSEIHGSGIRKGSVLCCMKCHKTGIEGHPALKRSQATDPKPEPKPAAMPVEAKPPEKETRRDKRARLFPPQPQSPAA